MIYKSLLRPLLFKMEAEQAHDAIYRFSKTASKSAFLKGFARLIYNYQSPRLSQTFWGLTFRNPIGLAAGFDKNGQIPEIMEAAGFGFVETGSITANPSTGNPKPRSFRVPEDHALINRMGLNNDGAKTIVKRLKNKKVSFPLGVSIAKTHDPAILGDAAIRDYVFSFAEAKEVADYITINISCPNTKEGKTFENPPVLDELLSALELRDDASIVPTLVKFSSDLNQYELNKLLDICEDHRVHGYVASNTSSEREGLVTDSGIIKKIGKGGLSGRPLAAKSVQLVSWIREATNGQKPVMGVGGIDSFDAALKMLLAGADLLQVYTGLIYEGPGLVKKINKELVRFLKDQRMDSLLQISSAVTA